MTALSLQIDDGKSLALHGQGLAPAQHAQVTQLLGRAMALIARDQAGAMEYVRQASALAGNAGSSGAGAGRSTRGGLAPWQSERVRRHVEAAFSGRIEIDDLARMTRLSTSHFSAAFRISFGTSPHAYICQRRVDAAQAMMLTTETPISEIALACGFADQPHLCRVFRRITGDTPAAWRRARREA